MPCSCANDARHDHTISINVRHDILQCPSKCSHTVVLVERQCHQLGRRPDARIARLRLEQRALAKEIKPSDLGKHRLWNVIVRVVVPEHLGLPRKDDIKAVAN
eukprot:5379773-Prymnesium_polylepis.1